MKKILVVLTGGTIGSRIEGDCVDVTKDSPYRLLQMYEEVYGKIQAGSKEAFEVIQPFSILSENMGLSSLTRLCQVMWDIPYEKYEGVIVTHGSDTLPYTSALLGMLLCHVPVPVVLIASNYPLGEKGSNGLVNFRSAVELITTGFFRGVFTVYQNNRGENNVYIATRLTEADPYLDQFGSFGGVPLGRMDKGIFHYQEDAVNPSMAELSGERKQLFAKCPELKKPVLFLRPYPGLDYENIDLTKKPAAVLHGLYHSATACTAGEERSMLRFIERCQKEEIPVYAASAKERGGRNYVTAKAVMDMGVVFMENIAPEAAYAKLLLLGNIAEPYREKLMETSIYFERLL